MLNNDFKDMLQCLLDEKVEATSHVRYHVHI